MSRVKRLISERLSAKSSLLVGFQSKRDSLRPAFGRGRIKLSDKFDAIRFERARKRRKEKWGENQIK